MKSDTPLTQLLWDRAVQQISNMLMGKRPSTLSTSPTLPPNHKHTLSFCHHFKPHPLYFVIHFPPVTRYRNISLPIFCLSLCTTGIAFYKTPGNVSTWQPSAAISTLCLYVLLVMLLAIVPISPTYSFVDLCTLDINCTADSLLTAMLCVASAKQPWRKREWWENKSLETEGREKKMRVK